MNISATVAALCVNPRGHYRQIPGVDCYDLRRDVRTFGGGYRSWRIHLAAPGRRSVRTKPNRLQEKRNSGRSVWSG